MLLLHCRSSLTSSSSPFDSTATCVDHPMHWISQNTVSFQSPVPLHAGMDNHDNHQWLHVAANG